jgi:hypothetical protein
MLRTFAVILALVSAAPALAQQQPRPPVSIPSELVERIYNFLAVGGTNGEAAGLRAALAEAAAAPQREAEIQKRIDAAVAAAKANSESK